MIQIDMPMPETCGVCPFNYDFCWCNAFGNNDDWEKYSDDWNDHVCDRKTRPEYCPLKEIVRCKECKHYEPDQYCPGFGDCMGACDNLVKVHEDWYCASAERKE